MNDKIGAVIIGRNEGERLIRCLKSVLGSVNRLVYVDSGSSDDSPQAARALGAEVVALDSASPFTAARARNAGFRRLSTLYPELDLVFFVDGDCEVYTGWLDTACAFMALHPEVAIVWGQRRERFPGRSIYNLLCDIEWRSFPIGDTVACGGDALVRTNALLQVDGYRDDLICGEEPELCVRIRQKGWRVWHLDEPMTLHDAAMYRFGQWWKRMVRGGYGFAQGAALHGHLPERHWVNESRRVWLWGLCIPVAILCLTLIFGAPALVVLALYPLQVIRLAPRQGFFTRSGWLWAAAMVIGKFPEMLGQLRFLADRCRHTRSGLIEYK